MADQLTTYTDRLNVNKQVLSLGMIDAKRRVIGLQVKTYEVDFVPVAEGQTWGYTRKPGHYFGAECHTTRNGKTFGACQPDHYFTDKAERDAYIMTRLQSTADRYKRQDGVSVVGSRDLWRG